MSAQTFKQTTKPQLKLLQQGSAIKYPLNSAISANTFYPVATIDITGIDPSRLDVFMFGNADFGTVAMADGSNIAFFNPDNFIFPYWKISGNTLQIGFYNSGSGFTPTKPYINLYFGYYVLYY